MITGVEGHECLRPGSSADVGVPILAQREKRAGWCRVKIRTKQPNNGDTTWLRWLCRLERPRA